MILISLATLALWTRASALPVNAHHRKDFPNIDALFYRYKGQKRETFQQASHNPFR